jgi:hypothetical protein
VLLATVDASEDRGSRDALTTFGFGATAVVELVEALVELGVASAAGSVVDTDPASVDVGVNDDVVGVVVVVDIVVVDVGVVVVVDVDVVDVGVVDVGVAVDVVVAVRSTVVVVGLSVVLVGAGLFVVGLVVAGLIVVGLVVGEVVVVAGLIVVGLVAVVVGVVVVGAALVLVFVFVEIVVLVGAGERRSGAVTHVSGEAAGFVPGGCQLTMVHNPSSGLFPELSISSSVGPIAHSGEVPPAATHSA